jgi:hypothetical protein
MHAMQQSLYVASEQSETVQKHTYVADVHACVGMPLRCIISALAAQLHHHRWQTSGLVQTTRLSGCSINHSTVSVQHASAGLAIIAVHCLPQKQCKHTAASCTKTTAHSPKAARTQTKLVHCMQAYNDTCKRMLTRAAASVQSQEHAAVKRDGQHATD